MSTKRVNDWWLDNTWRESVVVLGSDWVDHEADAMTGCPDDCPDGVCPPGCCAYRFGADNPDLQPALLGLS